MSGSPEGLSDSFSIDAFHRGKFRLVQPLRRGHRSGTDAMMLAAAVPSGFSGTLVDLGAGAGAAGLAVASRCAGASITLVENAPEMADCARRSLALEENAELASRSTVIEADVRLPDRERRAVGLADFAFDWAIMNPPFNRAGDRASPDALRRHAHVMDDALLFDSWLRAAGWLVRPGGGLTIIARPESLLDILSAMGPYFGAQQLKALHPRVGKPATRIIIRAIRGAKRDLELHAPLILHTDGGNRFTNEANEISNGRASLFGD